MNTTDKIMAKKRTAFEHWAGKQSWIKDTQRYDSGSLKGTYGHCDTQRAWEAWKAGAAMQEKQP